MKMLPLLLLLLLPRLALAETTLGTAITALPAKITKAGVYHLTKDLAYTPTSGAAIEIETTDVIIDLNAHEILGVSGSTGVYASDQSRIVIKNGTIRGFQVGVNLTVLVPIHSVEIMGTPSLRAYRGDLRHPRG
jgi:hypothetical protein